MKPAALAIHWLLLAAAANATQPTAVIDQGNSVNLPSGGGVFLSAKKSTGEGPKLWHVDGIDGFLESEAFPLVGPRDGTYRIGLLVSGMVDGKPAWSSAPCTVSVGSSPPPPPPPPAPVLPPLAQVAFDAMGRMPPQIKALAPAFAVNFTGSADDAKAGRLSTPAAMIADIFTRNNASEGQLHDSCKDLNDTISKAIIALKLSPTDLPSHISAWRDLAAGFKAVQP